MKLAVVGFGSRGERYTRYFVSDKRVEFVAVCDVRKSMLDYAVSEYGVPKENCFTDVAAFWAKGKLADLLLIATQDDSHYELTMAALRAGYDILLEKPIADSLQKCREIYESATRLKREVYVCHELRYAPFFRTLKEQIASGRLGKISTINLTENVSWWHYSHSYIRGPWGVVEKCTPMILAKCSHDFDLINWFMDGTPCIAVSSFGSLDYFTRKNAPEGSAERCLECPVSKDCPYDARKLYVEWHNFITYHMLLQRGIVMDEKNRDEVVLSALADPDNKFGRCVFKCDNTAVDHQIVNMLFEGGATAHLTMTAFSGDCYREIHVHGTKGDAYGRLDENRLTVHIYGKEPETIDLAKIVDENGHGGGDERLVADIIEAHESGNSSGATSLKSSLASHIMAYSAEQSRLKGGELVKIDNFAK